MAQLKGTTFSRLASLLGERSVMTIGNNTTAERDGGAILIRLHGHAIVRLHEDSDELGNVDFTLAGYGTVTTRERVNQFTRAHGVNVCQHKGTQQVQLRYADHATQDIYADDWYNVATLYAGVS